MPFRPYLGDHTISSMSTTCKREFKHEQAKSPNTQQDNTESKGCVC